jgi:hypothetical protein
MTSPFAPDMHVFVVAPPATSPPLEESFGGWSCAKRSEIDVADHAHTVTQTSISALL